MGSRLVAVLRYAPPFDQHAKVLLECFGVREAAEVKHFRDCSYCSVTAAGVSLAFDGLDIPVKRRLGCIHITPPCIATLPHGLALGMTGKQLVEAHGEPTSKGGGHTIGSIFIIYSHLGFQANFERPEWTADNVVKGFDLFPVEPDAAAAAAATEPPAADAQPAPDAQTAVASPPRVAPNADASTAHAADSLPSPVFELSRLPREMNPAAVARLRLTVQLPLVESMREVSLQVSHCKCHCKCTKVTTVPRTTPDH